MLCHCPDEVDDYTDTLLMQLVAFLKNKKGNIALMSALRAAIVYRLIRPASLCYADTQIIVSA